MSSKTAELETFVKGNTTYVITDAKKKTVKKLYSFDDLEDLINEDVVVKKEFLNTIHRFLREKAPDTTTRRNDKVGNWVMCKGYKITIDDELGFAIFDMQDYNRHCEEFENACPTPREVWEFINRRVSEVVKAKEVYVVTKPDFAPKEEKHYTEKKEEELNNEEFELLRADLLQALEGISVPKMIETVWKFIPNRKFNHRINKLCNAYLNKEMRGIKFKVELLELITTHKFEEIKKPAKKFVGLGWYSIVTLETIKDEVSFVTKTEGRFHFSKSEFLARYLLHLQPKAMPQVWRFINGFITREQLIEEPVLTQDVDAKYIDFDTSCLRKLNADLYYACIKILMAWEEPNPLGICYKNDLETELKVGDFVEVMWKDYHTCYEGKVIDFTGGVRIRYEDGLVLPLYKWQDFVVTNKRVL